MSAGGLGVPPVSGADGDRQVHSRAGNMSNRMGQGAAFASARVAGTRSLRHFTALSSRRKHGTRASPSSCQAGRKLDAVALRQPGPYPFRTSYKRVVLQGRPARLPTGCSRAAELILPDLSQHIENPWSDMRNVKRNSRWPEGRGHCRRTSPAIAGSAQQVSDCSVRVRSVCMAAAFHEGMLRKQDLSTSG